MTRGGYGVKMICPSCLTNELVDPAGVSVKWLPLDFQSEGKESTDKGQLDIVTRWSSVECHGVVN